ncbi:endoglucanase Acf2 [Georgenia soli]|uniref:glucan endo-1,3-beta-D-glucosidase n=1 Tax=Georgenia soli TaxID=638953 RepID=A0A2A9EGJ6_9MICO|nr:glycosyl hydrolase [Georgenia soli]PFG37963.1 endoglucanase Acf2 [Georgenia soli]
MPLRRVTALLASAVVLTGCARSTDDAARPEETADASAVDATAAGLPTTTGPFTGEIAVADGVRPPTNSWLAPAVFAPADRPVFTGTLSVRLRADGLSLGLPAPQASEGILMGAHPDHVDLALGADDYVLERVDELSGTFAYRRDGRTTGRVTMAEGWPYVAYEAAAAQKVDLPASTVAADGGASAEVGGITYRFVTDGSFSGTTLELAEGGSLVVYAEPAGASDADRQALRAGAVPLTGTDVAHAVEDGRASTTFTYDTAGASTVLASLPHQETTTDGEPLAATVPSVYGELALASGNEATFSVAAREPVPELDLANLDDAERSRVAGRVRADAVAVTFDAADSYYAGKQLQRAAQLYQLATGLGLTDEAAALKERMTGELDSWFDPEGCATREERCFAYDEKLGGLVGQEPSYGSDEFNDHHFHYGHMLYALGVLAADDPALAERYAAVADAVAHDIAAPEQTAAFPQRRSFDDWWGHSWASGTAPFGDGNNQESPSEAVNAWAGLALWADASGDTAMGEQARWMLANETATALEYWVAPELPEEFGHSSVGINWQGKRDFATFFDAAPSAVVGIQLIPMSPTHAAYLAEEPEAVQAMVDAAVPDGDPAGRPLVDYVIMAQALTDPDRATAMLEQLPAEQVDNGNSLSYLTAFVLSQD